MVSPDEPSAAPVGEDAGADQDEADDEEQRRTRHDRSEHGERLHGDEDDQAAVANHVRRLVSCIPPSTAYPLATNR